MGLVYADLTLENARAANPAFAAPVTVRALVDTGSVFLCIPDHVRLQLGLEAESVREATLADGKSHLVPYVGPVKVSFQNRYCYVGAMVLEDEVLLGAVPMEDMDIVVNPARGVVTVNPASPNIPMGKVK